MFSKSKYLRFNSAKYSECCAIEHFSRCAAVAR